MKCPSIGENCPLKTKCEQPEKQRVKDERGTISL